MPILGESAGRTDWGVRVDQRGKPAPETYVRILDGALPDPEVRRYVPLRVQASSQWKDVGLAADDYFDDFRREHLNRRAKGGADKGRVLYLRGNQSPLAALTWSLPPQGYPLVVRGAAAASTALQGEDAVAAIELLLGCLTGVAAKLGDRPTVQLAWSVRVGDSVQQQANATRIHELFDFDRLRKGRVPSHARRWPYLLRPKR